MTSTVLPSTGREQREIGEPGRGGESSQFEARQSMHDSAGWPSVISPRCREDNIAWRPRTRRRAATRTRAGIGLCGEMA